MDLANFILQRLAEDEAAGGSMREMPRGDTGWGEVLFDHGTGRIWATSVHPHMEITEQYNAWVKTLPLSKSAKRVLAECEAKRKIIAFHENWPAPTAPMLLAMAQIYADHPDFREEWRV